MAKAALVKIFVEIEFSPATSTTDGIMTISLVPTYGAVFPEATVETITLGTPIGNARIPGVTSEVPPVPPKEIIPSNLPCLYNSGTNFSIPLANNSVASALSFLATSSSILTPAAAATSLLEISGVKVGSNTPV
ncbi:hypothetical protein D3C75_767510 [compost metagenome]